MLLYVPKAQNSAITQFPQDTAGQERYRTITTAYYRGAMGFILMYDITNEDSFNAVQDWATQIKTYSWDSAQGKRHVLRIIYKN